MYFKEIELAGFKSFADRIHIEFNSGITAIVGPNGCGKSNVADAIRWVLGEQSSKSLRGTSMQDVIFNGTEKRKSLSYCEATLTFDNTDRFFNFEYDELAITRKLYRSGDSEYLLNRQPCRLKDIINLLFDSGIGKDGYSIIGQGKVEEIISAKPENRRGIFEEAAGISKFKSRKVETERKLERTRENLVRLNDILSEVERQLGPLKKQAENAKKYLEYKGNLKDLEVNAYIYQYENASTVKGKINDRLNAIIEEMQLRQKDLEDVNFNYTQNMENINNIDKEIDKIHSEILKLTVDLEKQSGEVRVIRERINYINSQNDRINVDILNNENTILKNNTELENKKSLVEKKNKDLEMLNQSYEEVSSMYLKVIDALQLSEDEAEISQKTILDNMDKIVDIKSNISKLKTEQELLKDDKIKISSQFADIKERKEQQEKLINDIKAQVSDAEKNKSQFQSDFANKKFQIESLSSRIKDEENERHTLSAKIQVYENRQKLLLEMQAEFEGYAHSVKKILRESERNSGFKTKIVGVLASLLKVPEKFETAIEVALGNTVQNIVTFNEQNAKDLINYLKENQFGRATFLPITTIKPRFLSEEDKRLIKHSGCFGIASELIDYDPRIKDIVSNLLGGLVVVDNLDSAIEISRNSRFAYKIVTLDGDIISPQGSMTGGSRKSDAVNLISRDREIETLKEHIARMKAEMLEKNKLINDLTNTINQSKQDLLICEDNKNNAEIRYAQENEKLQNSGLILDNFVGQFNSLNAEITSIENKLSYINEQLAIVENVDNDKSINKTEVNNRLEERQKKNIELKQQRDSFSNNLTSIRVNIASIEAEIKSFEQDLERIEEENVKQNYILSQNKAELTKNLETVEQAEQMITEIIETKSNSQVKTELDNVKNKQSQLEQNKIDYQKSLKEFDEKRIELQENINVLTDKKFAQEMQLSKVDTDIEAMQERIYEEYELTYETCLEFKRPDIDITESMKEIATLKKEISKLGYVNVNAIEESKLVLERYETLSEQVADLEKSEKDLTEIIQELSTEMVNRFQTQFNKINENFGITFKELFGGGRASLQLTESDNLLEAGVDIVAEPPGKKLQNINLLSGGEKALTAIAILFSILRLKPMPFCLLDEIEAALDDSNVERFAQYLRRFSKTTQFIVITHRKPTMELADRLYGVTMEEKGVSKTLLVNLADAIKNEETIK